MYSILTGEVEVYCDNKDALYIQPIQTQDISFPRYFRPNVDLKLQIQLLRQNLRKIEILPVHIKGHQDDDEDFNLEEASLAVRCNIEVDDTSKQFLKTHQKTLEPHPHSNTVPAIKSYISINSTVVHHNIEHHVRLQFFGPRLEQRFLTKNDLNITDIVHIHWLAIERGFRKLSMQDKLPIFKLLHKKRPTNMKVAAWDCNKNPMCPRCGVIEESFNHIFQCKGSHATTTHKKAIKLLKQGLRKAQVAPILQRAIIQGIEKHRKGYETLTFMDVMVPDDQKELAARIFHKQEHLGSSALMQGYLSKDWAIIQNVYNGSDDLLDDQVECITKIVKSIWKYSTTMWKARCEDVHGETDGKKGSKRRSELLEFLDKEMERTHCFGDFEIRQLRKNIAKRKGNANTASLET